MRTLQRKFRLVRESVVFELKYIFDFVPSFQLFKLRKRLF